MADKKSGAARPKTSLKRQTVKSSQSETRGSSSAKLREVKTPQALATPRSMALGYSSIVRTSKEKGDRRWTVTGRDYVGTVTIPIGGCAAGQVLLAQVISPRDFPSTRLSILSELYDNYQLDRFHFVYEPAVSTLVSGQIGAFIDRDSTDLFRDISEQNVRKAASHPTFSAGPCWSTNKWTIDRLKDLGTLYCGRSVDPHWSTAGLFQLMATTAVPDIESKAFTLGTVYMDYSVTFASPQLENPSLVAGGTHVTSGGSTSAAHPYGTAPTSDYNGIGISLPASANYVRLPPGTYQTTLISSFSASNHGDTSVSATSVESKQAVTAMSQVTGFTGEFDYIGVHTWQYLGGEFDVTFNQVTIDPQTTSIWINPIPARLSSLLTDILLPGIKGPTLLSTGWQDLLSVVSGWKVPAQLVKSGLDWLHSKGYTGRLSPVTKGFSKLLGFLLSHRLLGCDTSSQVPAALQEYWRSCGYVIREFGVEEKKEKERDDEFVSIKPVLGRVR